MEKKEKEEEKDGGKTREREGKRARKQEVDFYLTR